MRITILKSLIKRRKLEECVGSYFRDSDSELVCELNSEGKEALFGIQREDGVYTIIGKGFVYFSTISGGKKEMTLADFEHKLQINAAMKGKGGNYEFLPLPDEEIWLFNRKTMEIFWNIVLWMLKENNPS
jgi:hypothetical protein